jgi:hypothetical protein
MSETRTAYFCYTCSEEVTFRGTRIRYNPDGSLHLCKPEDKLAHKKYREYLRRDKTGWRLTGEDFWKWKREVYDVQRWTQSRDYYNELKEQREREQQRVAEAEAEERRKRVAEAEAEARRQNAAEEAAEEQRRQEQRKQASKKKRRSAGQRRKQKEKKEAAAEEQTRQQGRTRSSSRSRSRSRGREPRQSPGGRVEEALKIMGLTVDILRLSSNEAVTVIKSRFRTLAMKFHPDRGGDANKFMAMNEAHEYLLRTCTG